MDPHVLTDGMRFTRMPICQSILPRLPHKEFLNDLLTGYESWISTIPTHTVPFSHLEENSRLIKQSRACTSIRFLYAAGTRREC